MQDTDSTDLLSTAVSSARINEFADASRARNVVIVLDCCHAGAFRGGDLGDAVAGPGRYVLTSCRGTQLANDATVENGTSFFTQHLVDGLLDAAADQDGDGYVTFSDLYAYMDRRLREAGKQIPQRRVDGDGDVPLARRPQPAPAATPPRCRRPGTRPRPFPRPAEGAAYRQRVARSGQADHATSGTAPAAAGRRHFPCRFGRRRAAAWQSTAERAAAAAAAVAVTGGVIALVLLLGGSGGTPQAAGSYTQRELLHRQCPVAAEDRR